jgi:hypothetical protein
MKSNPYEPQHDTHERQRGGNTPASGEKHDSKKAETITEDRRFGKTSKTNSPGRVSSDAKEKD